MSNEFHSSSTNASLYEYADRKASSCEEDLRCKQEELSHILNETNVGRWEWNIKTGEIRFSELWAEIIGYSFNEISLSIENWLTLIHPEDCGKSALQFQRIVDGCNESDRYNLEYRMKNKDNQWFWVHERGKIISLSPDGKPLLVSGLLLDITDRKRLETELFNEKKLFETTLKSVGDGVISTNNDGNVVFLNKVAEALTGWSLEEATGKSFEEVFNIVDEYTLEKRENIVENVLKTGKILELANHTLLISKDGISRPIEDSAAPIIEENGNIIGAVLVFRDFSEKKQKQDEIKYLSYHDQLTGLYNRRFYEEELACLDTKENLPLTIAMGDVNGLKLTNDSFGHMAGDKLLMKIADVLKEACSEHHIIARLGGDEFVIIMPQTDSAQAETIMKHIKHLASKETVGSVTVSISLGYETKYFEEEPAEEIFKKAENRMYRKKLSESPSVRGKTIDAIISTLYEKNKREEQHSHRVSELCRRMAIALHMTDNRIEELKTMGLLHDIGKIAIDENILNKSDKLTPEEWREIQRHPEIGYRILSTVNDMSELASCVLSHHERWDGTGYPKGLKETQIPFESRIIAIADSYDAMTSERSYRAALPVSVAIQELQKNSGTQFDAELVTVFIESVLNDNSNT